MKKSKLLNKDWLPACTSSDWSITASLPAEPLLLTALITQDSHSFALPTLSVIDSIII